MPKRQREEVPVLKELQLAPEPVAKAKKTHNRKPRGKGTPSLKKRILADLRQKRKDISKKKKELNKELSSVKRDIRSLTCRKKPASKISKRIDSQINPVFYG